MSKDVSVAEETSATSYQVHGYMRLNMKEIVSKSNCIESIRAFADRTIYSHTNCPTKNASQLAEKLFCFQAVRKLDLPIFGSSFR